MGSGILLHKGLGGRRKYLVAFSRYDESEAYWLPESELSNALEIFNDYKVFHGFNGHLTMVCQLCISLLSSLWTEVK